jgi:membrane protein implicated in regulation of membrane protease activity
MDAASLVSVLLAVAVAAISVIVFAIAPPGWNWPLLILCTLIGCAATVAVDRMIRRNGGGGDEGSQGPAG